MYIDCIQTVGAGIMKVDWVGSSIDEQKILDSAQTEFGGVWELIDFDTDPDEGTGRAYIKQLKGVNRMNSLTNAEMNDLQNELEVAQLTAVGVTDTTEVLADVERVSMTDDEVDALAEVELEAVKTMGAVETIVRPKAKKKTVKIAKVTKTVEKKVKKIDTARKIFSTNLKQERKVVIEKIMAKTGLSKVAAATYYQICKRES